MLLHSLFGMFPLLSLYTAVASASCACSPVVIPVHVDVLVPKDPTDPFAGLTGNASSLRHVDDTYNIFVYTADLLQSFHNSFDSRIALVTPASTVSQHPLQSNIHCKTRPFYTGTLLFGSIVHLSPKHSLPSLQFFGTPPALATAVAGPDGIFEMDTGLLLFDTPPALATAVAGPDGIFEIGTGLWLFNAPPALATAVAGPDGIFKIGTGFLHLDAPPALATAVAGPDGIFEIGTRLWLFNAPSALATAVAGPDGIFEIGTGFLHLDAPPALATAVAGPDGIFEMDTGLLNALPRLQLFDAPPALATAVAVPNGIFEIDTGFLHLDTPPALPVAITVFRHRIPQ
ncbi:hypothetical protein K438DRAFT_2028164 [Mycena galopus ATCC 62051]|nr:hypothetical protein K438DRAFT_2028164 [Mycena galopus ATCC 62051]